MASRIIKDFSQLTPPSDMRDVFQRVSYLALREVHIPSNLLNLYDIVETANGIKFVPKRKAR